jgi:hypothetical protein
MSWADCEAELTGLTEQGTPAESPAVHLTALGKKRVEVRRYRKRRREKQRELVPRA